MQISDLRIGNVFRVGHAEIIMHLEDFEIYKNEKLDGIPLTAEALYRFGIIDDGGPVWSDDTWRISLEDGYVWVWEYPNHEASVKVKLEYIHQFQNLVHAVTGKEAFPQPETKGLTPPGKYMLPKEAPQEMLDRLVEKWNDLEGQQVTPELVAYIRELKAQMQALHKAFPELPIVILKRYSPLDPEVHKNPNQKNSDQD